MKRKKVFIGVALLVVVGIIAIGVAAINDESATIEDFSQSEAVTAGQESGSDALAPEDSWMLKFVESPAGVSPKNVYAFTCELVDQKPEALTPYCADFGVAVWKIKWAKWSAYAAEGDGTFSANNCDPNCADGKYTNVAVRVFLKDLTTKNNKYFYNTAVIVPKGKIVSSAGDSTNIIDQFFHTTAEINGKTYEAEVWDIASFYREAPDMRGKLP